MNRKPREPKVAAEPFLHDSDWIGFAVPGLPAPAGLPRMRVPVLCEDTGSSVTGPRPIFGGAMDPQPGVSLSPPVASSFPPSMHDRRSPAVDSVNRARTGHRRRPVHVVSASSSQPTSRRPSARSGVARCKYVLERFRSTMGCVVPQKETPPESPAKNERGKSFFI